MSRRITRLAAVSAVVLVLGGIGGAPALAGGPDLTSQGFPTDDQVCTVIAQPTPAGQDIALTPAPTTACFDTLGEALESVSGEPVTDPRVLAGDITALRGYANEQAAKAAAAPQTARAGAVTTAAASSMMLGIAYKNTNQTGGAKVFYGSSGYGCMTGNTYGFPKMSTYLMNNNISSMATYARCWSTLYDGESYTGTTTNCVPLCTSLGSMNDRTSSIVFRPEGNIA